MRARVLYLLTLTGRNVRQVRRLIRALFHVDHYFLIHIDRVLQKNLCLLLYVLSLSIFNKSNDILLLCVKSVEYLWRELSPLASEFANIRFTEWRLAAFWGSSSLLSVILRAIRDALSDAFSDWHWTHLINLSESDYPIR